MASSHEVVLSLLTVTFLLFSAAHSVQSALGEIVSVLG